ncbi:MAG: molybdopterin-dependent oxidoreductase [Rhizobiales bacterium]|nr:molybdopterin-dependent oxidoreductase [Hyphomicrobiales bacterium]
MSARKSNSDRTISTYCYQCVAGPDLLKVRIQDGAATEINPNFDAAQIHPAGGRVCVKAYGLIQKAYSPNRILHPMKRTNPKKGRDQDPGFVEISWDEALALVAEKLNGARAAGLLNAQGYPRVAASFGGGGTPTAYMGTLPAFLAAWGPVDMSFGSGQGVKCYHSEHLYGELWHRAFTVSPDTPLCEYLVSFGANVEASGGVCGVKRHADARARGMKRVQIEPHLSITGACSAEWIPIKPKTDAAFLFAMIHVLLHEQPRTRLDLAFLKERTSATYLIGPHGYFLRDPATRKPLVFNTKARHPVPFDTSGIDPAIEGDFAVDGIEAGPDNEETIHRDVTAMPAFAHLVAHVKEYTPEWAAQICDVSAPTIRRIANEYLDHARVGETIDIEGVTLPFRPVAIALGKTVNNGWGGYECCWARTLLPCLVGALEVPGGTLGTTVRLNRPADNRWSSVKPGPDGFMDYPMNPTSRDQWIAQPPARSIHRTLVPLVANSAWSQALGPTHLAWMMQNEDFEHIPHADPPDVWFVYRTNPAISFWDTRAVGEAMAKFPFTVCFAFTRDETNHMADVLLPDCTDLEGLQLLRIGGTKYVEQFWDYQGFALRDQAVPPQGEAKDFTFITTDLARRTGLLEAYNGAINRGAHGVRLNGQNYDFSLDPAKVHDVEAIWDATCRAASAEITDGAESQGLDWFREHGFRVKPFSRLQWYLYPKLVESGLRFEQPYQERLFRIGKELEQRLHEHDIHWWDKQLSEYEPLPHWRDLGELWERALAEHFKVNIADYPFWLITARSMQYSWGGNVGIQLIKEVADNVIGHGSVVMNESAAAKLGIGDGDIVEVASPLNSTRGKVLLSEGIRPDTLLMIGQFDHWATPFAKDFHTPSMNALMPMLLDLTDATGSSADLVKVRIARREVAA